jgi:hypothetical protein
VSHDAVTALSIHGAARADMSAHERATEIAHWSGRVADLRGDLARADCAFHLFRLLTVAPPRGQSRQNYLASRGGYCADVSSRREAILFDLFTDIPPSEEAAIELGTMLAEPVESGYLFESIALACFQAYGQEDHERILRAVASRPGDNLAARLVAYSVALSRRDPVASLEVAQRAVALGPDPVGSLARWCERLFEHYNVL